MKVQRVEAAEGRNPRCGGACSGSLRRRCGTGTSRRCRGEALYLKEPFDVARFEPQVEREVLAAFLLFGLGVVEAVQSLLSVPVFEAEREPVVGIVTVECGQG